MAHNELLTLALPSPIATPLLLLAGTQSRELPRTNPQKERTSMSSFAALPGLYSIIFLHLEPLSEVIPFVMAYSFPGSSWFHHQLIPSQDATVRNIDGRSKMAVWQLANCYLLLSMISSLVLRAARDALPHDFHGQERVVGALLTALAVADISHILATFYALPAHLQYDPLNWNAMTHGNITVVIVLFVLRMAWFVGIGRETSEELGLSHGSSKTRKPFRKGSHAFRLLDDDF